MTKETFLLDERAVSETLSVSLATVRRWRYVGGGPRFLKLGSLVRYKREDLDQWLEGKGAAG